MCLGALSDGLAYSDIFGGTYIALPSGRTHSIAHPGYPSSSFFTTDGYLCWLSGNTILSRGFSGERGLALGGRRFV